MDIFEFGKPANCKINLKHAANQIKTTIKSCKVAVNKLHEAGRYSLITPVIDAIVENLDGVKHHPQRSMRKGAVARGNPDWALVYEDLDQPECQRKSLPIFIVEAKVRLSTAAIAQTVLQMYEAYMEMRPKDHTEPWEMYGMVTTAVKVVFVKALFCGEQCDGVWQSKEFQIPHHKDMVIKTYEDSVTPVIQHAVAIANKQIKQIKRAPNEQTQQ
jgi:hypothetical protein